MRDSWLKGLETWDYKSDDCYYYNSQEKMIKALYLTEETHNYSIYTIKKGNIWWV